MQMHRHHLARRQRRRLDLVSSKRQAVPEQMFQRHSVVAAQRAPLVRRAVAGGIAARCRMDALGTPLTITNLPSRRCRRNLLT
jgi:hypothetical protein